MGRIGWRRAILMVAAQIVLASAILTLAGAFVSPNAMIAGMGVEALSLYGIVGWLFWPARAAVAESTTAVASDPTESVAEPVSGQIRPVKLSVAFCSATE